MQTLFKERRLAFLSTERPEFSSEQAKTQSTTDLSAETAEELANQTEISPENTEDQKALFQLKAAEIRQKTWILNQPSEGSDIINLHKNESERRLAAYTKPKDGKHEIYYPNMDQEYGIGLGEIFVDQRITKLKVYRGEKAPVLVTRGVTNQGRPCFVDENGRYFATFTGDLVEIVEKNEEMSPEEYQRALEEEQKNRSHFKEYSDTVEQYATQEDPISYNENLSIKDPELEDITPDSIAEAQKEVQSGIKNIPEIRERPNFVNIVKYIAKKVGIPASTIITVAYRESRINLNISGDHGSSKGLGHFKKGTWKMAKSDDRFGEIITDFASTEEGLKVGRGESVVADILGLAINLKIACEKMHINTSADREMTSCELVKMRFHYHVPGYAYLLDKFHLLSDDKPEKVQAPAGASDKLIKAINFYNVKLDRYIAYSRQVLAFNIAIS